MTALVLVFLLLLLVAVLALRISVARDRRDPLARRTPPGSGSGGVGLAGESAAAPGSQPPSTSPSPSPSTSPTEVRGDDDRGPTIYLSAEASGLPIPEGGSAPLPVLLEDVAFPDDLAMLTSGMTVADLDRRLVLSTARTPADTRAMLESQLRAAGFEVGWVDDRHGAASRSDGAMLLRVHGPVAPEAGNKPTGRKGRNATPTRPDFPSAPLAATVVELELPGPAFDGLT